MSTCQNGAASLNAKFCPQCGQQNVDLERPLWHLIGEVLRETFDVDGRALRTQLTLFRHPGVVTSEFLAGHRRRYTPPFRLYLVFSVVFFSLQAGPPDAESCSPVIRRRRSMPRSRRGLSATHCRA